MVPDKSIETDMAALRIAVHAWIRDGVPLGALITRLAAEINAGRASLAQEATGEPALPTSTSTTARGRGHA